MRVGDADDGMLVKREFLVIEFASLHPRRSIRRAISTASDSRSLPTSEAAASVPVSSGSRPATVSRRAFSARLRLARSPRNCSLADDSSADDSSRLRVRSARSRSYCSGAIDPREQAFHAGKHGGRAGRHALRAGQIAQFLQHRSKRGIVGDAGDALQLALQSAMHGAVSFRR